MDSLLPNGQAQSDTASAMQLGTVAAPTVATQHLMLAYFVQLLGMPIEILDSDLENIVRSGASIVFERTTIGGMPATTLKANNHA